MSNPQPSDLLREIGAKHFPRRYSRFRDLRPFEDACEWARRLDWRQNPYDRFLLRRELMRHLESMAFYDRRRSVFSFASREEIATEVDGLLDEFPEEHERMGVFTYVLLTLPWHLNFKHGRIRYSRLTEVLEKLPTRDERESD